MARRKRNWRYSWEPEYDEQGRRLRIRHPQWWIDLLCEAQNWRCCHCGGRLNEAPDGTPDFNRWGRSLEHVVRFRDGGADDWTNLVIAHLHCNNERD